MSTSSTIVSRPPEFQNCPGGVNLASKPGSLKLRILMFASLVSSFSMFVELEYGRCRCVGLSSQYEDEPGNTSSHAILPSRGTLAEVYLFTSGACVFRATQRVLRTSRRALVQWPRRGASGLFRQFHAYISRCLQPSGMHGGCAARKGDRSGRPRLVEAAEPAAL